MANPALGLERSLESKVYHAAVAVMREDPVLARVVRTWAIWSNDPREAGACTLEPTAAMLPMVKITPMPLDDRETTQAQTSSTMAIRIAIAVEGIDADDILDLWGAVRSAWVKLRPMRGTTVMCFLRAECGDTRFRVRTPGYDAFRPKDKESPLRILLGVGQVEIDYLRPA